MQSHTQVYLSRNTMVPKYKTSEVQGPCLLLKGTCSEVQGPCLLLKGTCVGSLVPVLVGRGKNIQRVGGK